MTKSGRAIEFSYNYKAWDEVNERYVNTNSIFALSKEDAIVIRTSNGKIIRDIEDLFPDFVNVSPKNHLQIMGRYVDVVS